MGKEKIKLLLVEDDTNFGAVLKDFLTFNDYEVTHAVDGEDGWKKFNADPLKAIINFRLMHVLR